MQLYDTKFKKIKQAKMEFLCVARVGCGGARATIKSTTPPPEKFCPSVKRASKQTPRKIRQVSYGRNYWTKLEPFSSNNFCRERQKPAQRLRPADKAAKQNRKIFSTFFNFFARPFFF